MESEEARILITGSNGFSAVHLIDLLKDRPATRIYATDINDCDLTKQAHVVALLERIKPHKIYHLAATFTNDYETDYRANVVSTKNLLDAVVDLELGSRVLLIGSTAEYGLVSPGDNPVSEDHPLNPVSVYGLTKTFQTHLMGCYVRLFALDVVMARTFNLIGKGISPKLVIGRTYEQIDLLKEGKISKITLGNLEYKRDYVSIQDAVECYEMIMAKGLTGEIYNVGSGRSRRLYDVIAGILQEEGLGLDVLETKPGPPSNSKLDVEDIYADVRKLNELKASGPAQVGP